MRDVASMEDRRHNYDCSIHHAYMYMGYGGELGHRRKPKPGFSWKGFLASV